MSKAKMGYSKQIITPDLGLQMSGYASDSRFADGIHDDLYTALILIEKDGKKALIIQNDMLVVDYAFTDQVRALAEARGIDKNNVFVGATHTHSGPKGLLRNDSDIGFTAIQLIGQYNPEMVAHILSAIDAGIAEALADMCETEVKYGFHEVEGVGTNRNSKDVSCDQTLLAIEFVRADGKRVLLYNYACHPTVLSITNTKYTADWPYGVVKKATENGYEMVLFLFGSAGEVSTRFTRKGSTFAEAERLGGLVYDAAQKALANAKLQEIDTIEAYALTHGMALRSFGTVEEAEAKRDQYQKELDEVIAKGETSLRVYESKVEGANINLMRARELSGKTTENVYLNFLKLNDLIFVFMPAELFSTLSTPIRKKFNNKVIFCTCFMGCHAYITDSVAYDNETYEAMSSPFIRLEGEKLMAQADEFLHSIQ